MFDYDKTAEPGFKADFKKNDAEAPLRLKLLQMPRDPADPAENMLDDFVDVVNTWFSLKEVAEAEVENNRREIGQNFP